ncbi:MAG: hybrid sensor histidine kinase/response regulator [Spartobacteria bacterium]|nr:hybrid sensor histidine kinase/response regulator [Spartobacteria bacterium]
MVSAAPGTVLVIDDERGPRESLRILLKPTYEVHCAESVDEGVAFLKRFDPDVIVMDIHMPGKSGIQGLKEIREYDPMVSVIMLTGYGTLDTAQQALRLGANDYVKKPFDTRQMLKLIEQYVQRTRHERQRRELSRDTEEINQQLIDEMLQMEQLASLGRVSAEFAHDLKNPLTIVLGYVELLTEQLRSVKEVMGEHYYETEKYLEIIEQNVARCQELARMWQTMGKAESQVPGPVCIRELIDEMRAGIEFLAVHDKASIEYDLAETGDVVWACRSEMMRALHNVVSNAIHAAATSKGTVRISTVADERSIRIHVKDDGCGIPPENMHAIFEPYFTTKEHGKGTGLGLVITKKIVTECNGSIHIDSVLGEGSDVCLELPVYHAMRIMPAPAKREARLVACQA